MKTGLYTNPIYLKHDTGSHPENADRLRVIQERLKFEGLISKLKVKNGRIAFSSEVKMLHSEKLISGIEVASINASKTFHTPDCIVSQFTYNAALFAVGSVLDAALEVGRDIAEKALKNGYENVVFDRGGYLYHGRVKSLADGAREKGLKF